MKHIAENKRRKKVADLQGGIYGAVSATVIALLSILGINKKIDSKVSRDAFSEYKQAQTTEHITITIRLEEIRQDVKTLLRNGK